MASGTQPSRPGGFTRTEVIILVLLGAGACAVFAVLGVMLYQLFLAPPLAVEVAAPPLATPTPTLTLLPAETAIPGWARYEGNGASLWLPERYVGGDLSKDLNPVLERLLALGPEYEEMAQAIQQNPGAMALWAFDPEVNDGGLLTNVNVVQEEGLPSVTAADYVDVLTEQLPADFSVTSRTAVSLDGYEGQQMVIESSLGGAEIVQMSYVVKEGDAIWAITYSTPADEYAGRLPTFERSVRTFAVWDVE